MSEITFVFVKNGKLYIVSAGWQQLMNYLSNKFENVEGLKVIATTKINLDAGYLVMDYDTKLFLCAQTGFALGQLPKLVRDRLQKEWVGVEG